MLHRRESRWLESVTGLCRHRSTFPGSGEGGTQDAESAPLIYNSFFPGGLIEHLPM